VNNEQFKTHHGLDGPGIETWWGVIFRTCSDRI